jgi:2-polyprenyl-6-methoxyphenol hydroxylase-like FAD-dependent oxidoreductase
VTAADILIVGAGPAGLTLANDLAMRGAPFRIIDSASEPMCESRAHGFANRTLLALDKLGLAEPILAAAKQPPPVLREYFGKTLVREQDLGTLPHDPYPAMLAVFQQRVTRVLEAALITRGHEVEWSTRLVSLQTEAHGVVAAVKRNGCPEVIKARWIVGCEGGRSIVRSALGLDDPMASKTSRGAKKSGFPILLCECDADWDLSRDIWWVWQSVGGSCSAIFNDFTGKWHISAMDLGGAEPTLERVEQLLRRRSSVGVRLGGADWVRRATSTGHAATRFMTAAGAVVGDAAHTFASVAGQGLHFAIEDAINLGWKLALKQQGAASPSLLETYDTERRERYEDALARSRTAERFLTLPAWVTKPIFAALYFVGRRARSNTANASKQSEQLQMSYPASPLTRQASPQATPGSRAGMHAPDAPCRIGGAPSRLLEIIRGPQADLLLFTGPGPSPKAIADLRALTESIEPLRAHMRVRWVFPSEAHASEAGLREDDPSVIVDGLEALQDAFGIQNPEVVYLRPDGYIGLRSASLEVRSLLSYLGLIYDRSLTDAPQRQLVATSNSG